MPLDQGFNKNTGPTWDVMMIHKTKSRRFEWFVVPSKNVSVRVFFIWGGPILGRQFLHHFCCWEVRKPSYLNRGWHWSRRWCHWAKKDDMTWLPEWGLTQVVETWMLNPIYDPWDGIDFSWKRWHSNGKETCLPTINFQELLVSGCHKNQPSM